MVRPPGLAKPSLMQSTAEDSPAGSSTVRQPHELHQSNLAIQASSLGEWVDDFMAGFAAYYLTTLPVLMGVLFGVSFLRPRNGEPGVDPVSACIHFDAARYMEIIQKGYSYDSERGSLVAFFPIYPLFTRWVGKITGLSPEEAALLTAHTALIGAFVLLVRWIRVRWPEATVGQRGIVLAVFGLWPLGLFLRMPYAESLFVCVTLAVLYGIAQDWPLIVLAMLVGFATAIRPVGMALTAVFIWHILTRSTLRLRAKIGNLLVLTPLACWGLLAYMGYQWSDFGTPWAFAQTQEHWNIRPLEDRTWQAKLWSLARLEPIWGVYVPGYRRYWASISSDAGGPLFNLFFWNPILFLSAVVFLVLGAWKRWLNGSEMVLGGCLLAIPYLTRGYEMSMASHGRFAAVVIVNYLVIGRLLARAAPLVMAGFITTFALLLCLLTTLYAAHYQIF